jgi:hypothetical protein
MFSLILMILLYSKTPDRYCTYLDPAQVKGRIDEIVSEPSLISRIEKGDELIGRWRINCRARAALPVVTVQFARLLERPELAEKTAALLYAMGDRARVVRRQVHAAYGNFHRDLETRRRTGTIIISHDWGVDAALHCLDLRLSSGSRPRSVCATFEDSIRLSNEALGWPN